MKSLKRGQRRRSGEEGWIHEGVGILRRTFDFDDGLFAIHGRMSVRGGAWHVFLGVSLGDGHGHILVMMTKSERFAKTLVHCTAGWAIGGVFWGGGLGGFGKIGGKLIANCDQ